MIPLRDPGSFAFRAQARFAEVTMPDRKSNPDGASRVTRRGLDPDVVKHPFTQEQAVRHTVERHPPGQAELFHPGLAPNITRHLQHYFFRNLLDAPGEVHFPLRKPRFRLSWRASEKLIESPVRHPQTLAVTKVRLVHSEASVFADF